MDNKKITFLKDLNKKVLEKKNAESDKPQKDWKNTIYGFECANYVNKC